MVLFLRQSCRLVDSLSSSAVSSHRVCAQTWTGPHSGSLGRRVPVITACDSPGPGVTLPSELASPSRLL